MFDLWVSFKPNELFCTCLVFFVPNVFQMEFSAWPGLAWPGSTIFVKSQ